MNRGHSLDLNVANEVNLFQGIESQYWQYN